MKLEIGCGERPTEGYLHQDIIELGTKLDFICQPWEISLEYNSVSEIIAIGVMEHLRFNDFRRTLKHFHYILKPEGVFFFDVPDLYKWSEYLYKVLRGGEVPFTKEHILATFYGWQRWDGDEHKSAWTIKDIYFELSEFNFLPCDGLEDIKKRVTRNRFGRIYDAHIYIKAIK